MYKNGCNLIDNECGFTKRMDNTRIYFVHSTTMGVIQLIMTWVDLTRRMVNTAICLNHHTLIVMTKRMVNTEIWFIHCTKMGAIWLIKAVVWLEKWQIQEFYLSIVH